MLAQTLAFGTLHSQGFFAYKFQRMVISLQIPTTEATHVKQRILFNKIRPKAFLNIHRSIRQKDLTLTHPIQLLKKHIEILKAICLFLVMTKLPSGQKGQVFLHFSIQAASL